jgi:hypothetical protein
MIPAVVFRKGDHSRTTARPHVSGPLLSGNPYLRTESQSTDSMSLKMPPPIRTLVTVSGQIFPSTVRIKSTVTGVWGRFDPFFLTNTSVYYCVCVGRYHFQRKRVPQKVLVHYDSRTVAMPQCLERTNIYTDAIDKRNPTNPSPQDRSTVGDISKNRAKYQVTLKKWTTLMKTFTLRRQ